VFSEVCAGIDRRNTVQQHIHQHIRDFIAIDVGVREGRLVDLAARWGFIARDSGISQELYVDPRTGLIRLNRNYRSWRHDIAEQRRRQLAQIAMRRRVLDELTFLLLLNDIWFRVETDVLPRERLVQSVVDGNPQRRVAADFRYDVVLRRHISRASSSDRKQCEHLYGSGDLYAVCKRQIPTREIKAHGLR
jgi:HAMP domain-containing protein